MILSLILGLSDLTLRIVGSGGVDILSNWQEGPYGHGMFEKNTLSFRFRVARFYEKNFSYRETFERGEKRMI